MCSDFWIFSGSFEVIVFIVRTYCIFVVVVVFHHSDFTELSCKIDNLLLLVQIMARYRTCDKPLPEEMMT